MMTVTTTPTLIYLLVAVFAPSPGALGYADLFQTVDQAACEAQAADWSARLAPTKFACVGHSQKALKTSIKGNDNVLWFVGKVAEPKGGVSYVKLYEAATADKDACDAQAKDWSTKLAPQAFVCVKHARSKLEEVPGIVGTAADDVER